MDTAPPKSALATECAEHFPIALVEQLIQETLQVSTFKPTALSEAPSIPVVLKSKRMGSAGLSSRVSERSLCENREHRPVTDFQLLEDVMKMHFDGAVGDI